MDPTQQELEELPQESSSDEDEPEEEEEEPAIHLAIASLTNQFADLAAAQEHQAAAPPAVPGDPAPAGGIVGGGAAASPDVDSGIPADEKVTREMVSTLPAMMEAINGDSPEQRIRAVTRVRNLLSIEPDPPIDAVIESGIVPHLVRLLTDPSPEMQFAACWALSNIAGGTSEHTRTVVEPGAVPVFVSMLSSPSADVREQAAWALGNVAGDSPANRDYVISTGVVEPLVHLLSGGPEANKLSTVRKATWTMSNLCRGKPKPEFSKVAAFLPVLAQLLRSSDSEILTDACRALSYLSDGGSEGRQAVVEAGVVRRIVELMMHSSPSVQTPATRTAGNIVTGDDLQTQIVIISGVCPVLLPLLSHPKKSLRKDAMWTVSNILAGNPDQIQAIIDANIIPPIMALLQGAEFDIRKEAAWCVSNGVDNGTVGQVQYFVSQGAIQALCELLSAPDTKILMVCLEGLEGILRSGEQRRVEAVGQTANPYAATLEQCGGLDKIKGLQTHQSVEVSNKALTILSRDFNPAGAAPGSPAAPAFGIAPVGVAANTAGGEEDPAEEGPAEDSKKEDDWDARANVNPFG